VAVLERICYKVCDVNIAQACGLLRVGAHHMYKGQGDANLKRFTGGNSEKTRVRFVNYYQLRTQ